MTQLATDSGVFESSVGAGQEVQGKTPWQLFWARFKEDKAAFVGLGVIVLLAVIALTAPFIGKYVVGRGPNDLSEARSMTDDFGLPKGPNSEFWFGADRVGRDLFVRVLYGARTS
ncbi:MAG: ABC transporter permease, partial [Actinobacteria bacterium]|nr:ABC transporter permease [Actinomycetota bacterium]